MNRLLSGFVLSTFLFMAPIGALAASGSTTALDQDKVVALEVQLFTHPVARRTIDERVSNLEQFVFGSAKSGDLHPRITALGNLVARPATAANTSDRDKQVAQARSQLRPAAAVPSDSIVSTHRPTVAMVPQIVIQRKARVQTVVTVVDRIESLELDVFGQKQCAKKLQLRVARLEKSLFGNDFADSAETITRRVNRLWFAYIGTVPGM